MNDERARALRRRVDALSQDQRQALAESLAREGGLQSPERLVGFVVADRGSPPSTETLREFLAGRLPDYMVPARFVALARLPRTAAGKLDRQALSRDRGGPHTTLLPNLVRASSAAPDTYLEADAPERLPSAPSTELETRIVAIWRDVLKASDIGVDDDFFEIGGDSLLSIRVIARAAREGIRISPERFFERPTVRHMAAAVSTTNGNRAPLPHAVGEAPLTPIQHWFLDAIPEQRDWWNQSYLLELGQALDTARLREVVGLLVAHHDALRLRLVHRDGRWQQDFLPPNADVPCRTVAIDGDPDEYAGRVAAECDREHASLRVDEGKLFRCILFEGRAGWRRLLLIGHHLVVDGVSWNVILEDLATLLAQAAAGEPLRLPAKSASARAWAIGLAAHAATPPVLASANHWLEMPADGGAMPVDTSNTSSTNRDAEVVTLILGPDESRRLLHDAPRRLETTVLSLLLAALLLAWRRWSGTDALRLDIEGLGRDVLGPAVDVSRTVGWFTTVFPARLAMPDHVSEGAEPPPSAVVQAVQETLGALPLRGAAHGLLRHLAPDESVRAALASQPRPAMLYNHLGTRDLALSAPPRLRVMTNEPSGRPRSPDAARPYLLELNSHVQDGTLTVTIEYARTVHHAATIERLATLLREALHTVANAVPASLAFDAAVIDTVAGLLEELDASDERVDS